MESLYKTCQETNNDRNLCEPCKEGGETHAGFTFCMDCNEVFCVACTKCHKNFKISKGHALVDITGLPENTSAKELLERVGLCGVHTYKDVERYCTTHDIVVCSVCLSTEHNGCDTVKLADVDEKVPELINESKTLLPQVRTHLEHLSSLHNTSKETINNFKEKLIAIKEKVECIREQVVKLVDKMVSHIADVANKLEKDHLMQMDDNNTNVLKAIYITEEKLAALDAVTQQGSRIHAFILANLTKKQMEENKSLLDGGDKCARQLDVELDIADNLKTLIESSNVEGLVDVRVVDSKSNQGIITSPSIQPTTTDNAPKSVQPASNQPTGSKSEQGTVTSPSIQFTTTDNAPQSVQPASNQPTEPCSELYIPQDRKLVKVRDYTVTPAADCVPWYNGIAVQSDGCLILNDYNRGYVSLYNPLDRSLRKMKLRYRSYNAVELHDRQIAVGTSNKSINVMTVGGELAIEKTLHTPFKLRGIVCLSNNHLAVAWTEPPAFGVIDISGTAVVEKLYFDQDTDGDKLKAFEHLAVNEMRQHVIQSCAADKSVRCYTFKGSRVFAYKGVNNPQGVTVDSCGSVYVCESGSPGSIHVLSPVGDLLIVVKENVPAYPLAICSDVTGTEFWVTRYASRGNVTCFRLV